MLSELARPAQRYGWGIGVTVRVDPYFPRPLPGVSEEELMRVRMCAACAVRYAVFGEHRFCCPRLRAGFCNDSGFWML